MATAEVLAENEVTTENLATLFKRAFFSTSFDEDGALFVNTDAIRGVLVSVDEEEKALRYLVVYGVKETVPLELKLALVNKMNHGIFSFARFSIDERHPDRLVAEYCIPFEEGISAFQIVSALRLFSQSVSGAIRNCDDNDLVDW